MPLSHLEYLRHIIDETEYLMLFRYYFENKTRKFVKIEVIGNK